MTSKADKVFIKRSALKSALEASKNLYPNEFIGLFRRDERGVLAELVIAPLSEYGEDFSSFNELHLPADSSIVASFHSHPGWSNLPSGEDLQFFSKSYGLHFIAKLPFSPSSVACYDSNGKKTEFETVE